MVLKIGSVKYPVHRHQKTNRGVTHSALHITSENII